jgi:amino acid transporter
MKRIVDRFNLLFVSVGSMIGSGWMFGPLLAAKIAGPYAILAWILGGFLVMVIALVFIELSVMFPLTGGVARFPQFSHGPLISFVMTWIACVAYLLLPPIEVQSLLLYAGHYIPGLVHVGDGQHLSGLGVCCAVMLLGLMSYLNLLGIHWVTRLNRYLVFFKILIPVLTALGLMFTVFHMENFKIGLQTGMQGDSFSQVMQHIVRTLPLAGIIFSYFGFRASVELGGEVQNPQRSLPLSLIGSILCCMCIYVCVQTAFIAGLPTAQLQQGWNVLSLTGDNGPFVALAELLGLFFLVKLILIDAVISPFGSALMILTTTARVNYAMSVNGYFPKWLQRLNRQEVPYYAIGLNWLIGSLLLLPFPGWQEMVSLISAALVVSHAIAPISLIALRRQLPDQKRLFKLPCAGFICRVAFIILNCIAYWTTWPIISRMLLALCVGLVFLGVYRCMQQEWERIVLGVKNSLWLWAYLSGLAGIAYIGDPGFGGLGWITFGWDFLSITMLSLVIFEWSLRSILKPEEILVELSRDQELVALGVVTAG